MTSPETTFRDIQEHFSRINVNLLHIKRFQNQRPDINRFMQFSRTQTLPLSNTQISGLLAFS